MHTSFASHSLVPSVTSALMSCHPTRPQRCSKLEIERGGDTGGGWEGLIRGRIRGGREQQTAQSSSVWHFEDFREICLLFTFFFFCQPNKLPQKWGQGEHECVCVCVCVCLSEKGWEIERNTHRGKEEVFLNSGSEGRGRENSLGEGGVWRALVVGSDELKRDKND